MTDVRECEVVIPRRFSGADMSSFTQSIRSSIQSSGNVNLIKFNFSNLSFIRPSGVTYLNNMVSFFNSHKIKVVFSGLSNRTQSISYLDDSQFFKHHTGNTLSPSAKPRSTTLPLMEIASNKSHMWLRLTLLPWISEKIGLGENSLHEIQTSISEIFNNIADHTRLDIGSIFVQYYPNESRIIIAVADFGIGIPGTVRRVEPGLTDEAAIIRAVQEGFTSKSIPQNRGAGLDYLLRVVALTNTGKVTVYSGHAIVSFEGVDGKIVPTVVARTGYSPGTLVEIEMRTDMLLPVSDESEDLVW